MNESAHAGDSASASVRLTQSRERMRDVLRGNAPPSNAADETHTAADPAMLPLLDVAQLAIRHSLEEVAERYPLRLVGVAMLSGAALVWVRPWRWLLQPALIAGLAARALTRVPVESVIDMLLSRFGSQEKRTPEPRR